MKREQKQPYFTKGEIVLWGGSAAVILIAFVLFRGQGVLSAAASLIGVTSLIFNAKGNPIGQALMVVFSIPYGIISWGFAYYGEMITYLGMTGPMALAALIAWLRHPFKGNKAEVAAARLSRKETAFMLLLTAAVTAVFYFVLRFFNTASLALSTLSVATSFAAVYLTWRRSPYFALVYAMNDVVLIALWVIAAQSEQSYVSVVICFVMFLVNDLYGFLCWRRMQRRQESASKPM